MLRELIKARAETEMLREQILQTVPALEDHYEVDLDASSFMMSNESKIAETGMTNWMDMTQEESHGQVVQIIKGIGTHNQSEEFPTWNERGQAAN